jgi:hypothetical protein
VLSLQESKKGGAGHIASSHWNKLLIMKRILAAKRLTSIQQES